MIPVIPSDSDSHLIVSPFQLLPPYPAVAPHSPVLSVRLVLADPVGEGEVRSEGGGGKRERGRRRNEGSARRERKAQGRIN
jgi:hypothetical protein